MVDDHVRKWFAEAAIGLFIAGLLMMIAAVSLTSVHFVYQGF
jgi:hypothetical protein